MAVCGSGTTGCHGWLESHREIAIEHGYIVSQWADPHLIPVLLLRRRFVYLDDQGGYTPNPS